MAGEWLLTNGLGGYAMGLIEGPPGRTYHGYLVAATHPPDGRTLLVGPIETWLEVDGAATRLDELETATDRVEGDPPAPTGVTLGTAQLVRTFEIHGVLLEQRAWMIHDANATVVRWRRLDEDTTVRAHLDLTPLVGCRDHHGGPSGPAQPETHVRGSQPPEVEVTWGIDRPALVMRASGGTVRPVSRGQPVHYREAAARGTTADETLHAVATFGAPLSPGSELVLVLGTETGSLVPVPSAPDASRSLRAAVERVDRLVQLARVDDADQRTARLVETADRFLVRRRAAPNGDAIADPGRTIIAGYPWFGDWGRDTMIALPGLALATGRVEEGARILRTWAGLLRDGLLPNHFPEDGGHEPAYHSVDAPLWFVHAIGEHERVTGDPGLALELRPAVEAILGAYTRGTRFGIGVDAADGLVRAGEADVQPTWMDAKVDGRPITPRHGKPVEIQALWVNALRQAAWWAIRADDAALAARHEAAASLAGSSFLARFWRPDLGWLADVVDGPSGDDVSLRPNQLIALSLPHPLVGGHIGGRVLDAVETHLVVPGGIRSLAPFEVGYRPRFQGPPAVRDGAYHQGTAWTWLLGPWIDALARFRDADTAAAALATALDALDPACTGAIPEILEPEPPHEPRGCPWQAWGVGELLRVHRSLQD